MKVRRFLSIIVLLAVLLMNLPVTALASSSTEGGEPQLLEFTVKTGAGQEVSLLQEGTISVDLGDSYSFTAKFSLPEQVEKVYVTSTKGGAVRLLEAVWDGSAFTTNGYFNDDQDYIPGKIGVEYIKKTQAVSMNDTVDWSSMQSELGNAVTVTSSASSSADDIEATVDVSSLLEAVGQVAVDFALDVFDESTDGNLGDWLDEYQDLEQFTKYALDGGNYFLYLDYSDPATYAMILRDVSGNKYFKAVITEASSYFDALSQVSEQLSAVNTVSNLTYQYLTIQKSADQLREEVSSRTDLTSDERTVLNENIDAYESDRFLFTLVMTLLPAVMTVSGVAVTGSAILFNALLGVMNAASDTFWDYRIGMLEGCDPVNTNFIDSTHGILLDRSSFQNYDFTITESGTYYLADDLIWPITIGDGQSTTNVVICKDGYDCDTWTVSAGSTLEVKDCTYEEDADGNRISEYSDMSIKNNGGYVTVQSGTVDEIEGSGGYVDINGGTVRTITGGEYIRINGGTVTGGVWSTDAKEIEMTAGTVESFRYFDNLLVTGGKVEIVRNEENGKVMMTGGEVGHILNADTGQVEITGGLVQSAKTGCAIDNSDGGTVTISGGTIAACREPYFVNTNHWDAIENGRDGTVIINGGKVIGGDYIDINNSRHSYTSAIDNDGTLVITGGEFVFGSLTGDGVCLFNAGFVEIWDGNFVGEINSGGSRDNRDVSVIIHGGTFQALGRNNVKICYEGSLEIDGGIFHAENSNNIYFDPDTDYGGTVEINSGEFYCSGDACVENTGWIAALGDYNYCGNLTINGGSFQSDVSCVRNYGMTEINAGTFIKEGEEDYLGGLICNENRGTLTINGGFYQSDGCCVRDTMIK